MSEQNKYVEDLREIKDMMNRSSRFISLSGISGILAGVFALAGAYLAYETIYSGQDYLDYRIVKLNSVKLLQLLGIASGVLTLSLAGGVVFAIRKARQQGLKIWDVQSKRLLINLIIPLLAGGVFCLILISKGLIGLVAPATLIFYGLALVNASKYTLKEIRGLGIIEIALGLLATYFIGFGLLFWAIGFGIFHIIYGIWMHITYDL